MSKYSVLMIIALIGCFGFYALGKIYSYWFVIPQTISTVSMFGIWWLEAKEKQKL